MKTKSSKLFLSVLAHLVVIGALVAIISPIIQLYLTRRPMFGVDFYLSVTYVSQLLRHFSLPTHWWQYFWYTGSPGFWGYPFGHFYAMLPLAAIFGIIRGIQWYSIGALVLFLTSAYLLFFELARSRIFALFITIAVAYSSSLYGALLGGGNLPYFATQAVLPLALWAIIRYLRSENRRWLYFASLITGLGFFGHPGVIISFVIPFSGLLLFSWRESEELYSFKKRLSDVLIFFSLAILSGWTNFYKETTLFIQRLSFVKGNLQSYAGPGSSQSVQDIGFLANLFLPTSINRLLLVTLAVLIVLWLVTNLWRRQKTKHGIIPLFILIAFLMLSYTAYLFNLNPFLQGWLRSFWPYILLIGALNCALLFSLRNILPIRLIFYPLGKLSRKGVATILSLLVLAPPLYFFTVAYPKINLGNDLYPRVTYEKEVRGALKSMATIFDPFVSSAYPYQLGTPYFKEDLLAMKERVVPDWLDGDQKNFRFYDADAEVSLGWSALFDMPQTRGYIYPRNIPQEKRSFSAWLDIAMNENNLVEDWGITPVTALNQTLFLIDWYAVKFIEGNPTGVRSFKIAPSSYLKKSGAFQKDEVFLYQPVIGIIGEKEPLTGLIASFPSFRSRFLGVNFDDLDMTILRQTDALVLTDYQYQNAQKSNLLLEQYLQSGRGVFVNPDEVKEIKGGLLEIFPIEKTETEEFVGDWDFYISSSPAVLNLNTQALAKPEGMYAVGIKKKGAVVDLAHQGKPLLIEKRVNPGIILWSGLNLSQKATLGSPEETKLIKDILSFITISTPLHYYEVAAPYTSPILSATNVPVVGIFAPFEDYEIIIRNLASINLNSQRLIPVNLGESIDIYTENDLKDFDALILIGYNYFNSNKAWHMLEEYVEEGGKVFIDTGRESKESAGTNLPSLLPADSLDRNPLGTSWDLKVLEENLFKGVDPEQFSPPLFDDNPWKFSYPESSLRPGVKTILSNHDKPVLTFSERGEGLVIWSGLNLFYHASRGFNQQELNLIKNLADLLAPPIFSQPSSSVTWITPRRRLVETQNAKGILFKENYWSGWKVRAKTNDQIQNLPIYKAGPIFPGFMYAPLPEGITRIEFSFSPSLSIWVTAGINLLFIILLTDYTFFAGKVVWLRFRKPATKFKATIMSWWEKE